MSSIDKGACTTCNKIVGGGDVGQPLMPRCGFAGGCFQWRGGVPWQHAEAERLARGAADGEVAELRQHGPGGEGQARGSRPFDLHLGSCTAGKARCFSILSCTGGAVASALDNIVCRSPVRSGMCIMLAGLGVWVVAFYLPYAWFSLTFNYSYGQEPGFVAGMTFSMVVVAGNVSWLTVVHCALWFVLQVERLGC